MAVHHLVDADGADARQQADPVGDEDDEEEAENQCRVAAPPAAGRGDDAGHQLHGQLDRALEPGRDQRPAAGDPERRHEQQQRRQERADHAVRELERTDMEQRLRLDGDVDESLAALFFGHLLPHVVPGNVPDRVHRRADPEHHPHEREDRARPQPVVDDQAKTQAENDRYAESQPQVHREAPVRCARVSWRSAGAAIFIVRIHVRVHSQDRARGRREGRLE